jgi:hypothetical protein
MGTGASSHRKGVGRVARRATGTVSSSSVSGDDGARDSETGPAATRGRDLTEVGELPSFPRKRVVIYEPKPVSVFHPPWAVVYQPPWPIPNRSTAALDCLQDTFFPADHNISRILTDCASSISLFAYIIRQNRP